MNNVFAVSSSEATKHLLNDIDRIVDPQLALLCEQLPQVATLHVLHGDEFETLCLPKIVDSNNVAMCHLARQQDFLFKPLEDVGVGRKFGTDDLEGDQAIQFAIAR